MSLCPCPDCGHEVSPRADTCPRCGAPLAENTTRGRPWASGVFFGFSILALLTSVIFLTVGSTDVRSAVALVLGDDEIEWIIEEVDADLGCSRIGEFCVEVTCLARNVGERPNTSGVRAHLAPADGGAGFTDATRLRLDPGEERIVSFSFEEVQLGLEEYTHRCTEVAER